MNRKKFITLSIKGCAAAALAGCIGCSAEDNPAGPSNIEADFTIDLTDPANSALSVDGGSVYRNGVVIGRISEGNFTAVAQACTHQGFTIQFQLANNRFHCPNHGSNFNLRGEVINGPATRNLQRFNASLEGNILRIFH